MCHHQETHYNKLLDNVYVKRSSLFLCHHRSKGLKPHGRIFLCHRDTAVRTDTFEIYC